MGYTGDLDIDNAFAVKLRNTSNSRQVFSMFELGSNDPLSLGVSLTPSASEPNAINQNWYLQNPAHPFGIFSVTGEVYTALSIFNVRILPVGFPPITITGGGILTLAELGDTMQQITDKLNNALLSTSYKYMQIQFAGVLDGSFPAPVPPLFDKDRISITITYFTANPENSADTIGYFTGDANDPTNPMLLDTLSFNDIAYGGHTLLPVQRQVNIKSYPSTLTNVTANGGIEIVAGDGTPYSQILESQSGGVLDIKSMRVDAISPSNELAQFQLLEPLKFRKVNADGTEKVHTKLPLIDPYQFQNSVDFLETSTKADTFTLDGQTKFTSGVQPNTSIRLTFNYTQLTNLVADSKYGEEMVRQEQLNIDKEKEEGDNAGVTQLKIPNSVLSIIEKDNKSIDDLEKKKNELLNIQSKPLLSAKEIFVLFALTLITIKLTKP